MTELRRFAIMLAALGACLAMMTGTALAGGWAEVAMTSDSEDPPTAGEEREIEFSLLQHGVTAVDYGNVKLTAVNPDTGQTITVPATNHGGGVWSATVAFPVEGSWQIGVAHDGLVTPEPTTMLVRP
ncbi:MAG: FixH family protein, partial [Candidatus Limnocylindria bacterium]